MRRECEGIPPSRDCRVSTAFRSRYYCSPGMGQEETKNNPWNARNIANDICDAGHTRLARMSFSNPMKSSARIHIAPRSFDPPMLKSWKVEPFIFSLLWNEWTSLLLNIITRCEIKKIASLRRGESMPASPIKLNGAIVSSSSNIVLASCLACAFPPSLFYLFILFLLSSFPYPDYTALFVSSFYVLCFTLHFNSRIHAYGVIQLSQFLFSLFMQKLYFFLNTILIYFNIWLI